MVANHNRETDDPPEADGTERSDEPVEPEVVEAGSVDNGTNRTPSEEFERLRTYNARENGVLYQISHQHTNYGTKWTLRAYGSGQGPIPFPDGISDEQAAELGLSAKTQGDLNATLKRAREVGELPRIFRGQQRDKAGLEQAREDFGMS